MPTAVVGLRACLAAIVVLAAVVASAAAQSGGVGPGGDSGGGDGGDNGGACEPGQFGHRPLERGDCGSDVETLNWLLKADDYKVSLDNSFSGDTHAAVREVQGKRGLRRSGVVDRRTRKNLVEEMSRRKASWYGPGFFGNHTACGQVLKRKTVGVAHRNLPCGTKVTFGYGGRFIRTRVIDRGPFVKQARYERDWDLTQALAEKLGFEGVDHVRSAAIR